MSVEMTKAGDYEQICPDCEVCLSAGAARCAECDQARPAEGWKPLHHAGRAYLGKILEGRYLLDRFLGGGASGRVYRAHDQKLNRPFALKILRLADDPGGDDERLRRFDKEVEALSRIRNPHVINIYESMRLGDQTPAMLTEYIAGSTLEAMLQEGRFLELDSALTLVHQIANGLHEAHAEGVIHRDLKPANVMVEKLPATGSFARILDFGLVHIAEDAGRTQGFWGTPLYAAPEQCGADGSISAATDIYSLGCMLFRCIAGRPVFERSSARALMLAQYDEPAPSLADVAPQPVPEPLDALVGAMLAKDPADRPEDMRVVIEQIDRLVGSNRRRLSGSVVVDELPDQPPEEPDRAGESQPAGKLGATSQGTRIGVADTERPEPRLAQLVQRIEMPGGVAEAAETIQCAGFDASGDCVVFADAEHRLHVATTKGADFFETLVAADVTVGAVVPDISSGRIFGAEQNGRLLCWRLEAPNASPRPLEQIGARIFALALGEQRQKLYIGTENGEILARDLRVGSLERVARLESTVCDIHLGAAGRWLVAATLDATVVALDRHSPARSIVRLGETSERPVAVQAMSGRQRAALVDVAGHLRLFRLDCQGEPINVHPAIDEIRALTFTDDHQMYALSLGGPTLRVWRIRHELFLEEPLEGRTERPWEWAKAKEDE